jgi:hypothetical protein
MVLRHNNKWADRQMAGIAITCCDICGDFLFNGTHRGHVEIWCRAIRETENSGTQIMAGAETENPKSIAQTVETKNRKRGRPRRETETPWATAGLSRATWYRRMKG